METEGLWHVTLTVAGEPRPVEDVLAALERLGAERPFLMSGFYAESRAELRYWDEASECEDACAMALRLWPDHRASAGLPPWRVVGLEVLERGQHRRRAGAVVAPTGGWRPF